MGMFQELRETYSVGVRSAVKSLSELPRRPARTRYQRQAPLVYGAPARRRGNQMLVSDELQRAVKAVSYSDFVNDFINAQGEHWRNNYTDPQMETAYATSVYLFSALRRVANLFSGLRFVGEIARDGDWERLPDTHHLNKMFTDAGSQFMYQLFMFYAIYGSTLIYKRKTRKGLAAYERGQLISGYLQGGIAGFTILPNSRWEKFEDEYASKILGFNLNEPLADVKAGMRDRDEFVYLHDFDPRFRNEGISMVSLAINNAITNASIARWAAHYFMSGAMPLLLISTEDDPVMMTEADLMRQKSFIEKIWQGMWGKFSLRAAFTDRKLNVQEAGITADKVQAPELNRDALNAIASVFQIAPDLIVPPEGGSDNARHKSLQMDAYHSAVLPVARQMVDAFNRDIGLHGTNVRLVVAEEEIAALDGDRADNATTETTLYNSGVQTYSETRDRMRMKPNDALDPIADWVNANGRLQSIKRLMRDDQLPSDTIIQYATTAWDSGVLKLSEARSLMFNLKTPPQEDGYKWQVVPDPAAGGGGFGGGGDTPPETPPQLPQPPTDGAPRLPADETPQAPEKPQEPPKKPNTDGDKAAPQNRQIGEFDDDPSPSFDFDVTRTDGAGDPVPMTPVLRLEASGDDLPNSACALLMIGDDPLIQTIAGQLEIALDGVPAKWEDPNVWHCTLVYSDHGTDEQVLAARKFMYSHTPNIMLRVDGLITFDTPAHGRCIALRVDPTAELEALQAHIRTAFTNAQMPISPFSAAGAYTPHITLCYVPDETPVPEFACAINVAPQCVQVTRDGYEVVCELPHINTVMESAPDEPVWVDDDPNRLANREALVAEAEHRRAMIASAIRTWRDTGEPGPGLADTVRVAIREAVAADATMGWDASLKACDDGYFDDHASWADEENPIMTVMAKAKRAKQISAAAELKAWARVASRGGAAKAAQRFEVHLVPLALEQSIRAQLPAAKSKDDVWAIFNAAFKSLTESAPKAVDEDILAAWAERMGEVDGMGDLLNAG